MKPSTAIRILLATLLGAAMSASVAAQTRQAADDYPVVALRNGHEGTATVRLTVDETGRPIACSVVVSSGWPELDAASCRRALRAPRFKPAHNLEGKPVQGAYLTKISWTIPNDDEAPQAAGTSGNPPAQ